MIFLCVFMWVNERNREAQRETDKESVEEHVCVFMLDIINWMVLRERWGQGSFKALSDHTDLGNKGFLPKVINNNWT